MRQLRRLLPLLLLLALASCGGGGGTAGGADDPDPAQAFPASTPVYVEATIRPEGDARRAVEALSAKFGIEDPGARILAELDRAGDEDDVDYATDIEPWLGRRAGIALTGIEGEDPPFVGALGVTDREAAKAFVERTTEAGADYRGTELRRDDDTLIAVDGDYVLIADATNETGLRRVIDQVGSDADSLADSQGYTDAVGDLPDARVGSLYVAGGPLVELLKRSPQVAAGGGAQVLDQFLGGLRSVAGAVTPHEDRAVLEIRTRTDADAKLMNLFSGFAQAPSLVKDAPADSVGVYGISDLGPTYKALLDQAAGALGGVALKGQLQGQLGIDLDADVFAWVGDTAVFVRGTSEADLTGAVMIDAIDEDAATKALVKLVGVAQQRGGLPLRATRLEGADQAWATAVPGRTQRAYVARAGGRVVFGYGEESTRMGLKPASTLDANGSYDRAKQTVEGLDPALILDAQKLVALVARSQAGDPDFAKARPYLERLGQVVAGSSASGDTQTSRIAVTVE